MIDKWKFEQKYSNKWKKKSYKAKSQVDEDFGIYTDELQENVTKFIPDLLPNVQSAISRRDAEQKAWNDAFANAWYACVADKNTADANEYWYMASMWFYFKDILWGVPCYVCSYNKSTHHLDHNAWFIVRDKRDMWDAVYTSKWENHLLGIYYWPWGPPEQQWWIHQGYTAYENDAQRWMPGVVTRKTKKIYWYCWHEGGTQDYGGYTVGSDKWLGTAGQFQSSVNWYSEVWFYQMLKNTLHCMQIFDGMYETSFLVPPFLRVSPNLFNTEWNESYVNLLNNYYAWNLQTDDLHIACNLAIKEKMGKYTIEDTVVVNSFNESDTQEVQEPVTWPFGLETYTGYFANVAFLVPVPFQVDAFRSKEINRLTTTYDGKKVSGIFGLILKLDWKFKNKYNALVANMGVFNWVIDMFQNTMGADVYFYYQIGPMDTIAGNLRVAFNNANLFFNCVSGYDAQSWGRVKEAWRSIMGPRVLSYFEEKDIPKW